MGLSKRARLLPAFKLQAMPALTEKYRKTINFCSGKLGFTTLQYIIDIGCET